MAAKKRKKIMDTEPPASTGYELFVRDLYQGILHQDSVKNIEVQHDVQLIGRSGAPYRVDVYWEFELAGTTYRTCIECRHYNRRIERDAINAFSGWLDDIRNANGIMVTTIGYQSGALPVARDKGNIRLLVINPLLQRIHTTINATFPNFVVSDPVADTEAVQALLVATGRAAFNWNPRRNDVLLDAEGQPKTTLTALVNTIHEDGTHVLPLRGFFMSSEIGLIPMIQVTVKRTSTVLTEEMAFDVGNGAKAIIEDVLNNTAEYVKDDGSTEPADGTRAIIKPG